MSAPPPPPPRRARGPVDPTSPAPAPPRQTSPPPRRPPPPEPTVGAATIGATAVPPPGPTRAQRRAAVEASQGKRKRSSDNGHGGGRKGLVIGIAVVVVLALAVGGAFAAGVFSSDGGGGSEPLEASTNVHLEAGDVEVRWPGLGPGQADPALPEQVMKVLGQYVDGGIVPALRTGKADDAVLEDTFDLGALGQLNGEPRGTLLDEGQPRAIGKLTITAPPVQIIALNDAGNATVLASAKLDLNIRVRSAKGYYTIRHDGEFVLVPDGQGAWRITGWDVNAERSTPTARPPWVTTTTTENRT
jgi:hypothetical protein